MQTADLGVVGLGRMAQALLHPLLDARLVAPGAVAAAVASEASFSIAAVLLNFSIVLRT